MLAEHFQRMYQNLNIDIENELEQLKVRETAVRVHMRYKASASEAC